MTGIIKLDWIDPHRLKLRRVQVKCGLLVQHLRILNTTKQHYSKVSKVREYIIERTQGTVGYSGKPTSGEQRVVHYNPQV